MDSFIVYDTNGIKSQTRAPDGRCCLCLFFIVDTSGLVFLTKQTKANKAGESYTLMIDEYHECYLSDAWTFSKFEFGLRSYWKSIL